MTENDQAALHAEYSARLQSAVARRDAELADLDRGYSAILASQTPDLAAAHAKYSADRAEADLRHGRTVGSIQHDYAQKARFGAQPLPAVVRGRSQYPAPLVTPGRRLAASPQPGRTRSKRTPKAKPFGKKPASVWRIAAISIGAVLVPVVALVALSVFLSPNSGSRPAAKSDSGPASSSSFTLPKVLYEVEGTAAEANITYTTKSGMAQNAVRVPLTAADGFRRGLTLAMDRGDIASISAQNRGRSGSLTCRITVDGAVVATVTSSGAYTTALCSAPVR